MPRDITQKNATCGYAASAGPDGQPLKGLTTGPWTSLKGLAHSCLDNARRVIHIPTGPTTDLNGEDIS